MSVFVVFFAVIGVLALACVAFLFSRPGDYEVSETQVFQVPLAQLYSTLVDFKTWPSWSPWLQHEPDCELTYSDNHQQEGGFYTWDGKIVGAGKLTHAQLIDGQRIEQTIEFLRPFKSLANTVFEFTVLDDKSTQVTWTLRGHLPFYLRFLRRMIMDMVSKDYRLGLAKLAGFLNPDIDHPQIKFEGPSPVKHQHCLSLGFSGDLKSMAQQMEQGLAALMGFAEARAIVTGPPVSVYTKADSKNNRFEGWMGVPVSDDFTDLASVKAEPNLADAQYRVIEPGAYFKVSVTGGYQFLELAWYSAYAHMKMKKIPFKTKVPSIETYMNSPATVDSNQLETTLLIPMLH